MSGPVSQSLSFCSFSAPPRMQTMLATTLSYLISTLKSVLVKWNPIVRLAHTHSASLGPSPEPAVPGKGPAPIPSVGIRYAKSPLLGLCCLWHCRKSFWAPLAATSMDWPHKSWSEGRQSAAGKGWGFGTASGVVDQWGTQLESVSGRGAGRKALV